jgi:hypothetical protein
MKDDRKPSADIVGGFFQTSPGVSIKLLEIHSSVTEYP